MRTRPATCIGCECFSMGTDFSQVEGSCSLGLMSVAEASGEHEQRDQLPLRPFAPAGSVEQRTLDRMGIRRQQMCYTNVLRCRPKNNWLENAPWEYAAIRHCRPNLDEALRRFRPRALRALGNVAIRELTGLTGDDLGVERLCGYVVPGPDVGYGPIPTVCSFHPSFIRHGKASHTGVYSRCLQRALAVAAGKDKEWLWLTSEPDMRPCECVKDEGKADPNCFLCGGDGQIQYGTKTPMEALNGKLNYITRPTLDDAERFLRRVERGASLTVAFDIETAETRSLDEDAREGFTDTAIQLIQFSCGSKEAIAIPWRDEFIPVIRRILATPNDKCGHNAWTFDNKVLAAHGIEVAGTVYDTMNMWGHWQADLPRNLQFAAQFVSFPFPWKHLAASDIEFYGCCDVDATLRLYYFLREALQREGVWDDSVYEVMA